MAEQNKKNLLNQLIFYITWEIIRKNKDKFSEKFINKIPIQITPDLLVYLRFLLTIILWLLFFAGAGNILFWLILIYLLAKITDLLDGSLARYRQIMTNYGEILDPLSDRLLNIVSLIILFSFWPFLSLWLIAVINIISFVLLIFDLLLILSQGIIFRFKNYRKVFEAIGYLVAGIILIGEIKK